jgi:hypothetical protein
MAGVDTNREVSTGFTVVLRVGRTEVEDVEEEDVVEAVGVG